MKKYIYLDWNVFQYMKHKKVIEGKFDAVKFKSFVESLKGKFYFPASEGHLKDLSATFKEENRSYIEEDLAFLNEISEGYMLGVSQNESLVPVPANINQQFENILNESQIDPDFSISGEAYNVDMSRLSKDSLFRPFLEANEGVLDANVMESFLQMMWESMDDPNVYKSLRSEVESLYKTVPNNNTIINQSCDYFKRIEPLFEIGKIVDIDVLKEQFGEIQDSFLAIDHRKVSDLTKGEKMQCAYMLLDFSPLFRDKVNKKNKPTNMHRDLKNLFFASDAKYYVTEDDATYKKSKFVVKLLGLPVKVVKMDELRLRLTCL
ncbi:hypothetical protein [Vibrio parahaemolyticus]|uniref:hypothetical protein n=1 Tax=Vibrio parahaemolyticus TaxID=670 RepID=UPI0004D387A0|nr:hypothetical protein [Vibrio parahaemolyticus]ODX22426.1 hypothetical protein BBM91_12000 [Vibrio parahaemolyticus]OQU10133.1 hypothetical protein EN01_023805 [Vibrio parahaemolyticus]